MQIARVAHRDVASTQMVSADAQAEIETACRRMEQARVFLVTLLRMEINLPLLPKPTPSLRSKLGLGGPDHADFVLARNAAIRGQWDEFVAVSQKYGVEFFRAFEDDWRKLLREAVCVLAENGNVDDSERDWLRRFVELAKIPQEVSSAEIKSGLADAFGKIVRQLVRDGELSSEDEALINRVSRKFGLSDSETARVYGSVAGVLIQSEFDRVCSDGLVSPAEELSLKRLRESLKVKLVNDDDVNRTISLGRQRWEALFGTLPTVKTRLSLAKSEVAHCLSSGSWYETKTIRDSVTFAGLSSRIRIAKGLSFHAGHYRIARPSREEMTLVDRGDFVLTSRRLIFMGASGNKSITWRSVLAANIIRADAVELEKTRGRNPVLVFDETHLVHPAVSVAIVQRLVENTTFHEGAEEPSET